MMKLRRIRWLFAACSWAMWTAPSALAQPISGIHALSRVEVPVRGEGVDIEELSGLAWDSDEQLLYAVSDRGYLHHFRLILRNESIAELAPVFSTRISGGPDEAGRSLENAEGLEVLNADNGQHGDSELMIAFEDGPTVERFSTGGRSVSTAALPAPLSGKNNYSSDKDRIEAVAFSRSDGLVAAPQKPLVGQPMNVHTIYAASGKSWSFPRERGSRVSAIEVLPDGDLLVLERIKSAKDSYTTALRAIDVSACAGTSPCNASALPVLSGKLPDDNFEGMARVAADLFVIVTDKKSAKSGPASLLLFRTETTEVTAPVER